MKLFRQVAVIIALTLVTAVSFYNCGGRQAPSQANTTITIMMPENDSLYRAQMIRYAQEGGADPLATIKFISKEIQVPATTDPVKASAYAAAEAIYPSSSSAGGSGVDSVVYFKIQDSTAYILLRMNIDGWAGVSHAVAIVRPVVEKTLLQYPHIRQVVWDSVR